MRLVIASDVVGGGGKELAVTRLAVALSERGHEVTLLAGQGDPVEAPSIRFKRVSALAGADHSTSTDDLVAAIRHASPDAVLMALDWGQGLRAVRQLVPVLYWSQVLAPICPAGSKYWGRSGSACRVDAGAKCLVLRPMLGCTGFAASLSLQAYRTHRSLSEVLASGEIGVLALSTDMRARLLSHGLPLTSVAVLPNLGIRLNSEQLARAAELTPVGDRGAVVFIGRLVHTKGAQLLPRLAREVGSAQLAVFGDGYLKERLQPRLGRALRGRIDQESVAGVLLWARGLAFTSLWPEPGGIVGVDAHLFGVPTAAFALGAPLDWPETRLVPARDIATMAAWLRARPPIINSRDPGDVSRAMTRYWDSVGRRAEALVEAFIRHGFWPDEADAGSNAVSDALNHALGTAS